ncbi:MAG: IPT/TIG domain-containing protein [Candidatus Saccharimonadales bacterium]
MSAETIISSPVALANNTWGYAINRVSSSSDDNTVLNGFDVSYASPNNLSKWADPTGPTIFKKTMMPVVDDVTDVFFGVKADTSVPAGNYTNKVTYSATANVPDPAPSPIIQSIFPTTGDSAGGETITIIGQGFTLNDQSVTSAVKIGGSDCANVQIASNTPISGQDTITCKIPARNIQAKSEVVDVDVFTWYGNPKLATSYTYTKEYFSFKIDTRLTDTLDNASNHFSGSATTFSIPASSVTSYGYDWLIDCGVEGQAPGRFTGAASASNDGYACNYPIAGAYVVTILPANHTSSGWLDAFGFDEGVVGLANSQSNRNLLLSIETPFPTKSRRMHYAAFSNTFRGAKNAVDIPANLFQNIKFSSGSAHHAFRHTFRDFGYNSTTMTLPDNLFGSFLDTSTSTTLEYTFGSTFMNAAYNSKNATIPDGLFSGILSFENYAYATTALKTDISSIWGSATLTGVTAANAGGEATGVFFRTFYNSRNINGNAQTFINSKLSGLVPTLNAGTFYGSTIGDIASLAANWKTNP